MSYELRPITKAEVPAFRTSLAMGFGKDRKPEDDERFLSLMPLERTVAAFEGDDIVATLGDFELQLTVPGGTQVATAGTTMVTVQATHTRRGILRAMMRRHLDNAVDRGDPVAGLWASEPGIYGRFGFGLATENHDVKIDSRHVTTPVPAADIELSMLPAAKILAIVAPFWHEIARQQPGFIDRDEARWQDIMNDPEAHRGSGSAARHVVARRDGACVGYMLYRQVSKWEGFVADGSISITDLIAADVDAHLALWAYALDVDLFPNVNYWNAAIDDPLACELRESRAMRRVVSDALYVRILDVEAALRARTYEQDGEVVFAVDDDMGYAGGTYKLTVVQGDAAIEKSTDPAEVTMGIRELGALYLGRACADVYARTGHIRGDAVAINKLGRLFSTARAPWCAEDF